eukprot:3454700-Rhodomonas_salina.2
MMTRLDDVRHGQQSDSTLAHRLETALGLEAQTRHSLIGSRQHSDSKLRLDTCSLTRDNIQTRSSDSTLAH